MPEDKLRRPLTIQSPHPDKRLGALNIHLPDGEEPRHDPAPLIPPPPAKHAERERFFQEKSIDEHRRRSGQPAGSPEGPVAAQPGQQQLV